MKQVYFEAETPSYIVDDSLLKRNLSILKQVKDKTKCKIILAQKAFSMYYTYPLIKQYLDGTTSSGIYEARLAKEEMGKEIHCFSGAYSDTEFDEVLEIADYIYINSVNQWKHFKEKAMKSSKSFGLRINPEHSTVTHGIYDPCAKGSRLGITAEQLEGVDLTGIEGLHFHTLCQQNSDALIETLKVVEQKFSKYFNQLKWINFGGGHHITREDYDVEALINCINEFKEKYSLEVYLEPGEAIALNAGFLVTTILDIVNNNVILDTSAATHMPDVLEMPYRPPLYNSGEANEKQYTYRLGGPTCLSGDIIGDYSFDEPLKIGGKLLFEDMAIYSMVKNNTFNGMPLPSIIYCDEHDELIVVKRFGYSDFKGRLS